MIMSNFSFFKGEWEVLAKLGESAEHNLYNDPHTSIMKLRLLGESIAKAVLASDNIREAYDTRQVDRLNTMKKEGLAEPEMLDIFHTLRRKGNTASHEASYGTTEEAKQLLALAYQISIWFMEVYIDWEFVAPTYREPEREESSKELQLKVQALEEEIAKKEKELLTQLDTITKDEITKDVRVRRKEKSKLHIQKHRLSEAQTRILIDDKLRAAGWLVDTEKYNQKKHKTMPEKNKNMAIAEWKVGSKYADYALFIGLQLVGIVEAKAKHRDIPSALESQAKVYAREVQAIEGIELLPPNGEYKVPFIFASNGRPYLRQLEDQSGIWFWDARNQTKRSHALEGWHSPSDLKMLLDVDDRRANESLKNEDITKFGLRDYQQKAVLAVEEALMQGARKMLVAMATGTGKTRTAIALMYRLIKAKKCRRILFLVDRNSLGQQTADALKDSKMENGLPFSSIYDVKSLEDMTPDVETKVQIATVQGMVRRLFYNDQEQLPSVGQYDFIIVDEAHRGYTSDREMTDDELLFRDQNDYVSQYRRVIDYFDAAVLGLTATPALHTTEIFGSPIYKYSYTEAVLDGYLVDHEPPYLFETELQQHGISFEKGEEVEVYDPEEGEIILEQLEDELKFEVEHFNKRVITEGFNRAVLTKLIDYIDPESEEKTLIFAATDQHADLIVRLLKEAFAENGDDVSDDAIVKITGSIYQPNEMIKRFKNERLPNIVVTVDLLTTGIDVPKITNIVFLRRIKSRILYDQMLGRATRLCPEIEKSHFRIFDAVGIYNQLQQYTDMKPVVKQQKVTIGELHESFIQAETQDEAQHFLDQLVAKVQRKKQTFNDEAKRQFEQLSKGVTVDEWAKELQTYTPEQAQNHSVLFDYVATYKTKKELQVIANHEDEVTDVKRGYGEGNERPTDYLDGFVQFIRENMNEIPALQIVCTRPKDLTRKDLREIEVILATKHFKQDHLQTAWKQAKNEEIAADIISFIRQAALGEALVSTESRVKNAMKKVYSMHDWTPRQRKWLERIEKQLIEMPVLSPNPQDAFSEEPFKSQGGYNRLKKELGEEVDQIVKLINESLYAS
ncbi:type I restriction-modification system endonuclease [Paenibacillus sp. F4]|uniref:type I restriction-modification system endonuclease n=1 Tax=Paenibacillus sp. F4 TaxID=357385 RepID=UPI000C9FE292|nr:type I restriction-modification system endonuclease [Paenibacillus sp. F4]PNQ78614.1 type I restriction-modification system endonuclease [Paenibacillus sp. F4]